MAVAPVVEASDLPAQCGVIIRLGAPHKGLSAGKGSVSVTSSAAPAKRPSLRESASASSSTTPPRDTTERYAVGFRSSEFLAPNQPVGIWRARYGNHDNVGAFEKLWQFVDLPEHRDIVRTRHIKSIRSDNLHLESMCTSSNGTTNIAEAENANGQSLKPYRTLPQLFRPFRPSDPFPLLLSQIQFWELARETDQAAEEMLRDGRSMSTTCISEHNVACHQFRDRNELVDASTMTLNPAQVLSREEGFARYVSEYHFRIRDVLLGIMLCQCNLKLNLRIASLSLQEVGSRSMEQSLRVS